MTRPSAFSEAQTPPRDEHAVSPAALRTPLRQRDGPILDVPLAFLYQAGVSIPLLRRQTPCSIPPARTLCCVALIADLERPVLEVRPTYPLQSTMRIAARRLSSAYRNTHARAPITVTPRCPQCILPSRMRQSPRRACSTVYSPRPRRVHDTPATYIHLLKPCRDRLCTALRADACS